ncbi:trypsin-like peptidase domain-containing protein [Lederbergia sp. NSJ-179]|uniref:S1C family serine protease n=1 Tax=Lederbergia sp. NSJ-179 TaxID=2931402 RepID=UPI001FD4451B|nr:trypsin-like peptidase domain-containing protein [Lederbergia sp. NSJ-179]MCJ7842590.1 trypsin-like peptidase domain-containing protein [Lederbergia sp. NSJ-179]
MTDRDDYEVSNITEHPKKRWKKGKTVVKRVVSTVSAGVIGSVLTLAVVINTPLLKETENKEAAVPAAAAESEHHSSQDVQQLSANTTSLADMVEKASKTVVGIVSTSKTEENPFSSMNANPSEKSGSGVLFKKEGKNAFIVTNNHVIEGADQIEVNLENGDKLEAELIGADALTDLAVLKIDGKKVDSVMKFGDSDQLRAGEQVVAIGNPLGLEFSRTVTQGIVSAVNRSIEVETSAGKWELNVIQTDAAINNGNSGGALVNTNGELIGINSLKISGNGVEGLGFAIPINDAKPLIEEMIQHGKIERPYMGISMVDFDQVAPQYLQKLPKSIEGGVIITSVDPDSAAGKAGLQMEDILVAINDHKIKDASDLRRLLYTELKVGDKASLQVYRDGKEKTFFITLTANPEG